MRDKLPPARIQVILGTSFLGVTTALAVAVLPGRFAPDPVPLAASVTTTASPSLAPAPAMEVVPSPPPAPDEQALYIQGQYAAVRRNDGVLAGLAALREAQALVRSQRHAEAVALFSEAGDSETLPAAVRLGALREGAAAARDAGRVEEARHLVSRLGALVEPGTTTAARNAWYGAKVLRDLGDPQWGARALTTVQTSPGLPEAVEALDALEASGISVPTMNVAMVRYRARQNDRAVSLFRRALDQAAPADEAARAWFYLGALTERADDTRGAIDAYTRSLQLAPAGGLASDALWWRGVLHADLGNAEAARGDFDTLARSFPNSQFADDAVLRAALLPGAPREAAVERLRTIVATRPPREAAAAVRHLRELGAWTPEDGTATAHSPFSFPALIEAAGGSPRLPRGAAAERSTQAPDWALVDPWMRERFGAPSEGNANERLMSTPTLMFATAASRVGEHEVARLAWAASATAARRAPHDALAIARLAAEAGAPDVAMQAAGYVVAPLTDLQRLEAPRAVLQLAYPMPFPQAIIDAATAEGVPPMLLLALIRQESAFEVSARSPVGALGLTQVMPETGQTIAGSLGTPWRVEMLNDPTTSIRFGAHYLGIMLRRYDGDVLAAVAAYNAGPGAADRWTRAAGGNLDAFISAVDYAETQMYIEKVLENYGAYRFAYGFAERPGVW